MELAHFYIWPDQLIFCRGAMPSRRSPDYCYTLGVVPAGGSINIHGNGTVSRLRAFAMRPASGRWFQINRHGLVTLHLDPDRDECRALDRFLGPREVGELPRSVVRPLAPAIAALYRQDESCASAEEVMMELLRGLVAGCPGAATEPVLRVVAAHLKAHPHGSLHLSALAPLAGISARWLTTVFHREVGISLKRYLLWAKISAALRQFCTNASLTDIALATGFADGAHLSRSVRRFTGLPPRMLRDERHVAFHPCTTATGGPCATAAAGEPGRCIQAIPRRADYAR